MIYYAIVLILLILGYFLKRKYYCIVSALMLIAFAGLRADSVGTDTGMYRLLYNNMQYINSFDGLLRERAASTLNVEWGYYLAEFIFQKFVTFDIFKVIVATVTIAPWAYVIYKRSDHPAISFVVLFTLPAYATVSLSAMRQGIAFGFSALVVDSWMDKKTKKALLMNLLAFCFHYSAIILLPLFFINKLKTYRHRYVSFIVPILLVVFLSSTTIFLFMGQYSRIDYEEGEASGIGTLIFFFVLYLISFIVKDKYFREGCNKWLVYLLVYTIALWFIGMSLAAIFRLAAYTECFLCLYISNMFSYIRKPLRNIIIIGSCLGSVLLMSRLVVSETKGNHFYPYEFIWENPYSIIQWQ